MRAVVRASGAGLLALGLSMLGTAPASAQVKASEHATMSQTIDGTVIAMEYHRPSVRGRDPLFGGQVHWGEVWTPGANWATILDVSRDIQLDGHTVPAGRYSVWMVVNPDEWEFVLEPEDSLYHTNPPELGDHQIRFMVTPHETDQAMETLAWGFPVVRWNGGTLRFHWGTTVVDLEVGVESSYQLTVTPDEAAPYLGTYRMVWLPPEGMDVPADTVDLSIELVDGMMVTSEESGIEHPDLTSRMFFIPRGEGFFIGGVLVDGELWEIWDDGVFEFLPGPDGAMEVEMRGPGDQLFMRAWRLTAGD